MVPKRVSAALQGGIALALSLACFAAVAQAGQDEDLDLIPQTVSEALQPQLKPQDGRVSSRFYLEDEYQRNSRRSSVVPLPSSYTPSWKNRFTVYSKADVRAHENLRFSFTDRLNRLSDAYSDFPSGTVQNDLNEAYVSWKVFGENYLDAGRINLKNGVAIGFNPVDYFKEDAVSLRTSEDPLVLRDNRLGTVMVQAQSMQSFGTFTFAAAPEISAATGTFLADGSSFGLNLQHTNPYPRYLAKFNTSVEDFNAELLYYNRNGDSFFGTALSRGFGDQAVLYGEWSGGEQYNLVTSALLYDARQLGFDLEKYASYVPGDSSKRFRNQAVIGLSFTEKEQKRSTYLEYHYNEAGMTPAEWSAWYTVGNFSQPFGTVEEALWSIRSYGQRMMQPSSRHQLFARTQWLDAMLPKLDLVGLAQVNPYDASFFLQPMAKYSVSDDLAFTLTFNFYIGKPRSEYGTVNASAVSKLAVTYFL